MCDDLALNNSSPYFIWAMALWCPKLLFRIAWFDPYHPEGYHLANYYGGAITDTDDTIQRQIGQRRILATPILGMTVDHQLWRISEYETSMDDEYHRRMEYLLERKQELTKQYALYLQLVGLYPHDIETLLHLPLINNELRWGGLYDFRDILHSLDRNIKKLCVRVLEEAHRPYYVEVARDLEDGGEGEEEELILVRISLCPFSFLFKATTLTIYCM